MFLHDYYVGWELHCINVLKLDLNLRMLDPSLKIDNNLEYQIFHFAYLAELKLAGKMNLPCKQKESLSIRKLADSLAS